MKIQDTEQSGDFTVQVYVRPGLLLEPLDATVATLQQFETDGVIDGVTVQAWPDTVPLSDPTPYSEVVDIFERFTLWAEQHDVSITPPFGVRTQSTITSDATRRVLSTPMLCLAVYDGRALSAVYPHADGDDQYSVTSAIAALRTGQFDRITPRSTHDSSTSDRAVDHCPDCTAPLVNVQGLHACRDCRWTERDGSQRELLAKNSVLH